MDILEIGSGKRVATLITERSITAAWLAALEHLAAHDREAFNLIVEICDPRLEIVEQCILGEVDRLLKRKGFQRIDTVANTIFPAALTRGSLDREHFYERYRRILPHLRKQRKNRKGTYFERLIGYPLSRTDRAAVVPSNQLETIIRDLKRQLARATPLRFVYEAPVFAPGNDRLPQGFPCMSSLSFQLDGDQLRLTATYRNQYYVQKALGNFLGLAHLQRFVADQAGLRQGPLTIHAFHAEIDKKVAGKRETAQLIQDCKCQEKATVPLPKGRH